MRMVNEKLLAECLRKLSDVDFQDRVWVQGVGGEVSSFAEVACQMFDDSGLSNALEVDVLSNELGDGLAMILSQLSMAIDEVDEALPPAALVRSEAMVVVRDLCDKALLYFGRGS